MFVSTLLVFGVGSEQLLVSVSGSVCLSVALSVALSLCLVCVVGFSWPEP